MALEEPKDWSEIKQFKDPVYGYIPVSRAYVRNLIDTQMMQRIKGVAQTGLRPVFSSATHDRFSHSLGVYKFSMAMYDSLSKKLLDYVKKTYLQKRTTLDGEGKDKALSCLPFYLKHWKTLLAIASLLHDIGHPVQSHGFEFLYDDPYLDMEYDQSEPVVISEEMDQKERDRVYQIFKRVSPESEKKPKGNLDKALLNAFRDRQDLQGGTVPGNYHEKMSAYYILKDKNLGDNISELITASWDRAKRESGPLPKEFPGQLNLNKDFCFIARMIIGWEYPAEEQLSFHGSVFFNSVRNCVIHILNGTIDADGIDYLMRNSYAAGYDTSKVDSTRLCNAYTAYEKNYVMFPAFSKSALSVLEGFIAARNFEPKWLYSHHKVVYADLLTKQLYKYITRYLTDRTMLLQAVKLFIKHAEESALVVKETQDFGTDFLFYDDKGPVGLSANTLHSHIEQWSYPFYTYLLAPCRRYSICSHHFSQTADADLENLFHWMLNELAQYDGETPEDRYVQYTQRLRTHVLEGVLKDSAVRLTKKQVRILLAETCLYPLNLTEEEILSILKAWVETGNVNNACRRLDRLGRNYSDVKNMLQHTADCDKRSLLEYWLEQYQPLLSVDDFADFISLLEVYQTRHYRSSLWKSYPEYQLFLNNCAHQLGVSAENVHRYMVALINDGMTEHGFSIFDGKAVKIAPNAYQEQFFFRFDKDEDRREAAQRLAKVHPFSNTPDPKRAQKEIAQRYAAQIFTETKLYDFSRNNLVIRFHPIKYKRFNKVCILFNNQPVPLEEILPAPKDSNITFPYFYYNPRPRVTSDQVLDAFQKKFIDFCMDYRKNEVGSENIKMGKNHVFRDAVYGDIEVPENFYSVICTREFQRLGRIRQLATADRSFPNATHTRLAHSIGTWHVMRLILNHFKQLYASNPQLDFSEADCNCALLAALLHDLGHGPYSHTIETVFSLSHEDMTQKMIMDSHTEIHHTIEDQFGPGVAKQVCNLLNGTSSTGYANGICLIYHAVISGQLDADRIDYLLRDNVACGMAFGHIDIQQLIASMRMLPKYDEERGVNGYCLCFDERYLPAIDQFIYARYQMYKNVYHDPRKQLFEQLFARIFRQAFKLGDEIELDVETNSIFPILKEIHDNHDIDVSKYILLDDDAVNTLIKKWAAGDILKKTSADPKAVNRAKIIQSLSKAFIDQSPLFEQIDLGGQQRLYDLLATRIGKQLNVMNCSTFVALDETYSAFIYIQGSDCAYKKSSDDEKNIVLRDLTDGTTTDYAQKTLFRSAHGSTENTILESDYCYLFFSEELLREDCLMHDIPEDTVKAVKRSVEAAMPRKHIEIEQKFRCESATLKKADDYLNQQYTEASRTEKEQIDTYYDCQVDGVWLLAENHFSFRCRERGGKYIFTVKIPTDSPNYHSPSQFARHEHELVTTGPDITDEVWQFLINTLDICEKDDLGNLLSREQMQVQLLVYNRRVTYRLDGKCEICLDAVTFKTAVKEALGDPFYQIEVELLGEPEDWQSLEHDVIEPLVKTLGTENLIYTSKSKLETGLGWLESGTL